MVPLQSDSPNKEEQKLHEMVSTDAQIMVSIQTIFPFQLFPTTLYVDRTKLTIDRMYFFGSHEIKTILIRDLLTITLETDLFFASLKIEDRLYPMDIEVIRHLPKSAAARFRAIAEGIRVGINEDIDLSQVPRKILINQAEKLGGVHGTPPTSSR